MCVATINKTFSDFTAIHNCKSFSYTCSHPACNFVMGRLQNSLQFIPTVNSHLVNVDKVGIDKVGIDEVEIDEVGS